MSDALTCMLCGVALPVSTLPVRQGPADEQRVIGFVCAGHALHDVIFDSRGALHPWIEFIPEDER